MTKEYFYGLTTEESREQRSFIRARVLEYLGALCLIALLALVVTWTTKAYAVQLDRQGCQGLAVWSHDIPLMRDLGADKAKVHAYLESQKVELPMFQILLRQFETLWGLENYGGVIQAVTRWRDKGGLEDLKKSIHTLELLIELESKS